MRQKQEFCVMFDIFMVREKNIYIYIYRTAENFALSGYHRQ